jgi:hypothetical protein
MDLQIPEKKTMTDCKIISVPSILAAEHPAFWHFMCQSRRESIRLFKSYIQVVASTCDHKNVTLFMPKGILMRFLTYSKV